MKNFTEWMNGAESSYARARLYVYAREFSKCDVSSCSRCENRLSGIIIMAGEFD